MPTNSRWKRVISIKNRARFCTFASSKLLPVVCDLSQASAVGCPVHQPMVDRTCPSIWMNADSSYALQHMSASSRTRGTLSFPSSNFAAIHSEAQPTSW